MQTPGTLPQPPFFADNRHNVPAVTLWRQQAHCHSRYFMQTPGAMPKSSCYADTRHNVPDTRNDTLLCMCQKLCLSLLHLTDTRGYFLHRSFTPYPWIFHLYDTRHNENRQNTTACHTLGTPAMHTRHDAFVRHTAQTPNMSPQCTKCAQISSKTLPAYHIADVLVKWPVFTAGGGFMEMSVRLSSTVIKQTRPRPVGKFIRNLPIVDGSTPKTKQKIRVYCIKRLNKGFNISRPKRYASDPHIQSYLCQTRKRNLKAYPKTWF